MLKYNTMRFGTDVFTLSGTSTAEIDDDPTEPADPPESGGEVEDDPTLPNVAITIGGNVYHFKLKLAST